MFKAATIFRLTAGRIPTNEELAHWPAQKPSGSERSSIGPWPVFVPDEFLANGLMCMKSYKRVLPAKAVKAEVASRAAEIQAQQGYRLGRIQMKELKEQIEAEMLPRAFITESETLGYFSGEYLYVDTTSDNVAMDFIRMLQRAIQMNPGNIIADSPEFKRLETVLTPAAQFKVWATEQVIEVEDPMFQVDLLVGNGFKAEVDQSSVVSGNVEMLSDLVEFLKPERLSEIELDHLNTVFKLTSDLKLKSIHYPEEFKSRARQEAGDDLSELTIKRATLLLIKNELTDILSQITAALGGEK